MKNVVVTILVLAAFQSFAQTNRFSISAGINYTCIKSQTYSPEVNYISPSSGYISYFSNIGTVKNSFTSLPGFSIEALYRISLNEKIFLSTGLGLQYMRFQRKVTVESLSPSSTGTNPNFGGIVVGQPMGTIGGTYPDESSATLLGNSENIGKTNTVYLQVPVLVGTSLLNGKLSIKTGLTTSFLLSTSETKQYYSMGGIYEGQDRNTSNYQSVLAGAQFQIGYTIYKGIGIDAVINKGLTSIYKEEHEAVGDPKYTNLMGRITYSF